MIRVLTEDHDVYKNDLYYAVQDVFGDWIIDEEFIPETEQFKFKLLDNRGHLVIYLRPRDTSGYTPRSLHPTHNAVNAPGYLQVSPKLESLLGSFEGLGLKEATNYSHPQWGTYKVIFESEEDLREIYDVLYEYADQHYEL